MNLQPQRIQIVGSSNAGKSTLAARLAAEMNYPFVELDALNWMPNWQGRHEHEPEEFRRLIREATSGDTWIAAGNYTKFSQELIWPKADTIIWLDLPLPLLTLRLLRRSWQRSRQRELLWGTNREQFWIQFCLWSDSSLLSWLWKNHHSYRRRLTENQTDSQWQHLRFIRLTSAEEATQFSLPEKKSPRS